MATWNHSSHLSSALLFFPDSLKAEEFLISVHVFFISSITVSFNGAGDSLSTWAG